MRQRGATKTWMPATSAGTTSRVFNVWNYAAVHSRRSYGLQAALPIDACLTHASACLTSFRGEQMFVLLRVVSAAAISRGRDEHAGLRHNGFRNRSSIGAGHSVRARNAVIRDDRRRVVAFADALGPARNHRLVDFGNDGASFRVNSSTL